MRQIPLILWLFLGGLGLAVAGVALPGIWGSVLLCFGVVVLLLIFGAVARTAVTPIHGMRAWELRALAYLGVISGFDIAVHNAGFEEQFGLNMNSWVAYGGSKEYDQDMEGKATGDTHKDAQAFARSWNRWNARHNSGCAEIDKEAMAEFLRLLDEA